MNSCALPYQANVSGKIRVILKREAALNGGLLDMAREIGENYHKVGNQANRNQGVLADLVVVLARHGFDEPLRIIADAARYELIPKIKFLRKAHSGKPVRSHALELHHATSTVTTLVERALIDGRFDDKERDRVLSALHGLRKKMAELEAGIAAEGHGKGNAL